MKKYYVNFDELLKKAIEAALKASVIKTFNDAASDDYLAAKVYAINEMCEYLMGDDRTEQLVDSCAVYSGTLRENVTTEILGKADIRVAAAVIFSDVDHILHRALCDKELDERSTNSLAVNSGCLISTVEVVEKLPKGYEHSCEAEIFSCGVESAIASIIDADLLV